MKIVANKNLIKEWNYKKNNELNLDPSILSDGSNKKVWWICDKGHEWMDYVNKRKDRHKKCPYCSNKKVLVGFNDLKTLYPELEKEWDYSKNINIDINTIVKGSPKKVWWKCSICGYEWQTEVRHRTLRNTGCPECAQKARNNTRINNWIKERGSIDSPLLLKEWNYERNKGLTPDKFTKSSSKRVWWKCSKCGYEWESKISNRHNLGRGCPACSNQVVVKGINDLETRNPQLAKEWDYENNGNLLPSDVNLGTSKKVWWKCPNGHSYVASVLHRGHGTNCPICNRGRQTSFAEQAVYYYIKKIYPDAINSYKDIFSNGMELDIFIPSLNIGIEYDGSYWHSSDKSINTGIKKYQICKDHNITLIRIKEKLDELGTFNSDYSIEFGENLSKEELSFKIQQLINQIDPASSMWTRKDYKHIYSDVIVDCVADEREIRKYMQVINQSVGELYPELVIEWDDELNGNLTPYMFKPHSDFKAHWVCKKCGYKWETTIGHRVDGTGCPKCYRESKKNK